MYYLTPICCVCFESSKNLHNLNDKDNQQLMQKFQYCTNEIKDVEPDVPIYMCNNCLHNLNVAYEFKKSCATNIARLRSYATQLVKCKLATDADVKDIKQTIPCGENGCIVYSDIQVNIARCSPTLKLSSKNLKPTICVVKSIKTEFEPVLDECVNISDKNKTEVDPVLGESLNINDEHLLFKAKSTVDTKKSIENLSLCLSEIIKKEHDITVNDSINQPIKNEILADEENFLNHLVKEVSMIQSLPTTSASLQSAEELDVGPSELENSSNKLLWNAKSEMITKSSDIKEEFLDLDRRIVPAANDGDSPRGRRASQTKKQVSPRHNAQIQKASEMIRESSDATDASLDVDRGVPAASKGRDSPRGQRTPQTKRQVSARRSAKSKKVLKSKSDLLYKCNTCHKEFSALDDLQKHLLKHRPRDQSCRCPVCGKILSRKDHLQRHLEIHSGNRNKYKCTLCPKQYSTNDSLRNHVTKTHQTKCSKCNKVFKSNKELHLHLTKEHLNEFYYQCEICAKVLIRFNYYHDHVHSHKGGTPFQCTHCPEAFQNNYRLKRHMALEHNIGKLRCKICGKCVSDKSVIDAHMKAHNTELPHHVCPQCGKRFKRKFDFTAHVKKHNVENCYVCGKCGKIYLKFLAYKNHMLTHSKTKSHKRL